MIRLRVYALTDLGSEKIEEYEKNLKPRDRWFMKRFGTSVEIYPDRKTMIISLNQIDLKALAVIKRDPNLTKKFEDDLGVKSCIDYERELSKLGIVRNKDYTLEVL